MCFLKCVRKWERKVVQFDVRTFGLTEKRHMIKTFKRVRHKWNMLQTCMSMTICNKTCSHVSQHTKRANFRECFWECVWECVCVFQIDSVKRKKEYYFIDAQGTRFGVKQSSFVLASVPKTFYVTFSLIFFFRLISWPYLSSNENFLNSFLFCKPIHIFQEFVSMFVKLLINMSFIFMCVIGTYSTLKFCN